MYEKFFSHINYFLSYKFSLSLIMKYIYKYIIVIILFLIFSASSYSKVNYLGAINIHSQYIFRDSDIGDNLPVIKTEFSIIPDKPNIWCNTIFTRSLSKTNFQEFKIMLGYTKYFNNLHELEFRTIYSNYPSMDFNSAYNIYLKYSYGLKIPISIDANHNFKNDGLYSSISSSFSFDIYLPWIIETSLGYNFNSYEQFNLLFDRGLSDFNTTFLTYIEFNKINFEPSITLIFPFTDNHKPEIVFSLYLDYIF